VYSSNNGYHERDVARDLDAEPGLSAKHLRATHKRPSIGRRIFRTLSRFFIAVLLGVAATLAWQSHGDEAKEMISAWAPSLGVLLPVSTTTSPVAASTVPRLAQQLEPMARDLAVVRRSLEQLAANQERMATQIATLNAVEKSSAPSWAIPILPSKPPQPAAKGSGSLSSPPARQPVALDRVGSR
jgi:hypothetical protein